MVITVFSRGKSISLCDFLSNMSDSISLPHSVQQLINEICTNQNQRSPDAEARQALASVGEEEALNVLRVIKGKTIHSSFSGFIKYLINQRHNSTHESPQKRPCLSPSHSHDGSPVNIVRPMNLSQGSQLLPFLFFFYFLVQFVVLSS